MREYENKTYGRKVIKPKKSFKKRLFTWMGISFVAGFLVAAPIGYLTGCAYEEPQAEETVVEETTWSSASEHEFVLLDVPMSEEVQEFVYHLSSGYDVEYALVMAVIDCESTFQADSVSKSNDYGLMQINKINHNRLTEALGVTDFLDPYQNTTAGVYMLNNLFEKYKDPAKVLMAYNMGETGASRLWEQGICETDYSKKVMNKAVEYEQMISEARGV
jgi:soluble lytic murein transglycosylase-like protein